MASSSVELPPQHQVFLNFRGKQLRKNFVSHLENALRISGVKVFIDNKETRGKDLTNLFYRIEESGIALAIFSSMYTESEWCLDELGKIMERVDLGKLVVIPIFYKVDTNDVKNLEGEFGANFWELIKKFSGVKIDKWKKALKDVPDKMGITLSEMSNESECITQIVMQVREVLDDISMDRERVIPIDNPSAGEGETSEISPHSTPPFGIETHLKQLEDKFDFGSKRTLTIGVIGMPGIGKTTLTKMLYERWQHKFMHSVFLDDVRDRCKNGVVDQNSLMKKLLQDDDLDQEEVADMPHESLKARLRNGKSLVVLDDVNRKNQIEILLGKRDWIKEGSRILITTSDRSVIKGKVDDTYEVLRLNGRDSLQCFRYYAFKDSISTPTERVMNLSTEFADYAKGNPLALTMLGKELNRKEQARWEENLSKLAESPNQMIQSVLQISYDELSMHLKDVFLDIACFFRSWDEYYVRCLVETCNTELIDGVSETEDLANKFLINVSGGRVEMHDLLYTFGKKLGSQGSHRLWNQNNIVLALRKREGADNVRGIFLDMCELETNVRFNRSAFTNMHNLRYLKFYSSHCHRECEVDCKINFPEEFEFPVDEIRYLYWLKFPLQKLPNDFNPKNLTDLNLPYSQIEEVWEGAKDTPKLKWVDLSHSSKLRNLSGLQNAESLQRLNLEGCTSLQKLPTDTKRMKSLTFLNMRGCTSLQSLPRINLISLETLILTNCSSLQEFQVISENLKTLKLDGTAITQLPTSIVKLQRLIVLNLKDCKLFQEVPKCLGKLEALQELVLSGCSELKTFPIPMENMKCLQILLLDGTAITDMPKIWKFNNSKVKDLRTGIKRGMNELSSSRLRRLCLSKNDNISNLQMELCQLHHLKMLDLKYCTNLTSIPLLPPNLEILDAHGCEKLKTVASPMATLKLMDEVRSKFIFTNCNNLEQAAKNSITLYAQRKSQQDAVRCYKEENVLEALLITSFPGSEVPSWFIHRKIGPSLELDFPPHWCDNRLSTIVLCAVVAFPNTQDPINNFSIECTCEFKNGNGTCIHFSCILGGGWIEPREIDSDHVFIGYTSSSHITNQLEESLQSGDQHKCVPTKASIKFEVRDGAAEIVNCGLSLVYEEPKHVVIEGSYNESCLGRDSILCLASGIFAGELKFLWLVVVIFLAYWFGRVFIK